VDWQAWHEDYEEPDSALGQRLVLVQRQVRAALDRATRGPVRAISICAGQGHDLIGVLADHPRRADVTARLVERDEHNALLARRAAHTAGLDGVEVIATDASITDAYAGAVPADLILLCGVLGNISAADIANTIRQLPRLCAPGATVIWTRHRHPPDLAPYIRETFEQAGFGELTFEDSPPFGVGANRLITSPQPFQEGVRLFEFIGYDVLQPDFHVSQGGNLGERR
jgi:CheY-like chemotaxis protein